MERLGGAHFPLSQMFDSGCVPKLEKPSVSWTTKKVVFVGQGDCGKSSTIRNLLGMPFKRNLVRTVGIQSKLLLCLLKDC